MKLHAIRSASRSFAVVTAALVASSLIAACASPGPAKVADGALTDESGKTLYTFDKDVAGSGRSACNGPCIVLWPAFTASATSNGFGDYTVVTRDDGSKQWAFKGKPLYTFSKDAKAGDRTGDGFNNNVWHIARP